MVLYFYFFFFFSSRRRHTRLRTVTGVRRVLFRSHEIHWRSWPWRAPSRPGAGTRAASFGPRPSRGIPASLCHQAVRERGPIPEKLARTPATGDGLPPRGMRYESERSSARRRRPEFRQNRRERGRALRKRPSDEGYGHTETPMPRREDRTRGIT